MVAVEAKDETQWSRQLSGVCDPGEARRTDRLVSMAG